MRFLIATSLTAVLLTAAAWADIVHLKNGGELEGKVTREGDKVYVERPDGTIILSMDQIDFVEPKKTDYEVYLEKLAAIGEGGEGAAGKFAELAKWADELGFKVQAEHCWKRTLQFDPHHDAARTALGYVKYDGKWLTFEDAQQARGLVEHGDAWVTPEAKSDLARIEEERKLTEARAREEALRLQRAEAEIAAAHAKAVAAQAQLDALREEVDYSRYGGIVVYPRGPRGPQKEKPVILGKGDRATITDANPINGTVYTKPDGTRAQVLTIYRENGPPLTRPIYGEPPQIIDPYAPPVPQPVAPPGKGKDQ